MPVLLYGSENDKERSRIRVVQMDNLSGLLGIRRMDRGPNLWIEELKPKGVDERVLRLFGHFERMENDGIFKKVYVESVWVVAWWVDRGRCG